ncbi:coiled-coil domain-containing protein 157-like [Thalassophryne amazonica]|uniref:coiled-coil domain-containing protein 157-like n=1 Tax=Thalassophryne amazonica TaxID=390379 RepID=UPI0014721544|nr:coiled-coil domain-containing protein 157-like [Thalassophryne amazonica]
MFGLAKYSSNSLPDTTLLIYLGLGLTLRKNCLRYLLLWIAFFKNAVNRCVCFFLCVQSVLAKQKSLLERVDSLDEECEDLHRQLGEKEEKEVNLKNLLQQLSEDKERLQEELTQQHALCCELQKEKQMVETHVGELKKSMAELKETLQVLKERERILVAFPELHSQPRPQTTGNVLLDMEHQLQANHIRINVLEQENAKLHSSVLKLRERAQHAASNEPSQQQTQCLSLSANQPEKQRTPMQSPVQSGMVPHFDSLRSDGSEDRLSTAASSPSSLKVHLQTLHLDPDLTKGRTKVHRGAPLPRSRGLNHRRK